MFSTMPWWAWGGFLAFVAVMLALDLGVFNRRAHTVTMKEALAWCAVDRSFSAQPGHPLARLVAGLLEAAVPPSEWEEAWAMPDPA